MGVAGCHQLGRRNLTDDQRVIAANEVRELRSAIVQHRAAQVAADARWSGKCDLAATSQTHGEDKPTNTRADVAVEYKVPEKKLRHAQSNGRGEAGKSSNGSPVRSPRSI